jgi:hypothetical protein
MYALIQIDWFDDGDMVIYVLKTSDNYSELITNTTKIKHRYTNANNDYSLIGVIQINKFVDFKLKRGISIIEFAKLSGYLDKDLFDNIFFLHNN